MQDSKDFKLFTQDLNMAMSHLKNGKSVGGITTEMVLNFMEKAKAWLLSLFNIVLKISKL